MANVENTIKLLWDCSTSLEPDTHTNKLLKSYYLNTCRKIAKHNVQVPKEKFAVSQMCPRCSAIWSESEFKLKLKPQKVASNGKAKKLISKLDKAISTQKKGILSKKQRRRAKWLKKRVCSSVEIQCERCKKKSLIQLQKPPQRHLTTEPSVEGMTEVEVDAPTMKNKKRKKKNKDTTAGLKIAHKHKTQLALKITETAVALKKPFAIKPDERISNKVVSAEPTPNPQATSKTPKLNTNPSGSVRKKNNKKKKSQATAKPIVQSETQKKNALLQLAALLKKQSNKPDTPQNRLQSLLK